MPASRLSPSEERERIKAFVKASLENDITWAVIIRSANGKISTMDCTTDLSMNETSLKHQIVLDFGELMPAIDIFIFNKSISYDIYEIKWQEVYGKNGKAILARMPNPEEDLWNYVAAYGINLLELSNFKITRISPNDMVLSNVQELLDASSQKLIDYIVNLEADLQIEAERLSSDSVERLATVEIDPPSDDANPFGFVRSWFTAIGSKKAKE